MTNKQLIDILQQYPPSREVILSILPCNTHSDELRRCGTYGIINVEEKLNFVLLSNHT